jgi:phage terminase large subunit-like protein
MEAGRVWFPKGKKWAEELVDELIVFPNGAHDDQVDAMTMAVHYMKDSWNLLHPDDPDAEDEQKSKKRVAYWNF